jgi:AraC-like DNA-binding protein
MGFKVEAADLEEFFSMAAPTMGREDSGREEKIMTFHTPKGDILFKELPVREDLTILQGRYAWNDDVVLSGKGDTALLEMHFNLSGDPIVFKNKMLASDIVSPMSGNITFLAADDNEAQIGYRSNVVYDTFDIHLPLAMLAQYEGESEGMDTFLHNVQTNRSASLSKDGISVGAKMFSVIQDIKSCSYAGLTRRIYLESKIYELIALSYDNMQNGPVEHRLSAQDLERIHFAAQVIRENIDRPLTIVDLARKAGVNQTKLKQAFKSVYGDTVFGYLQHVRMEKARQYLLDTDLAIQEIGVLSGYQSVSNFSVAFKKTFGYPPNALRRK